MSNGKRPFIFVAKPCRIIFAMKRKMADNFEMIIILHFSSNLLEGGVYNSPQWYYVDPNYQPGAYHTKKLQILAYRYLQLQIFVT
jgi:hypothetical protein